MSKLGLAARLSIFIMATTICSAACVGLLGALVGTRSLTEKVRQDLIRLVSDYADAISLYVDGARSMLLATTPLALPAPDDTPGGYGSRQDVRATAERVMSTARSLEYVMLTDARGRVLLTQPGEYMAQLSRPDVGFSTWFQEVARKRTTVVSDLLISIVTQRPSVVIAVPLLDRGGNLRGTWVGGLQLSRLSAFMIGKRSRESNAYGYVTDSRGLIIAHQARPDFVVAQTDYSATPTVAAALQGREGILQYVSPSDGILKLGAFLPLPLGAESQALPWTVSYVTPSSTAFQPVRLVAWLLAGLAILLGAALASVSSFIIRRTLRPVSFLANAAREMEAGNLSARAPPGMRFELAELADSFNRMAASVSASQESLEARARELQHSTDQLTAANKELESFSYSVSHDLRAPLRSIDGFSKAVVEDYYDLLDDQGKEHLRFLREAAQKMGQLIDDMLKLARVTRGELDHGEVDLSAVAKDIGEDLVRQNPERHVQFAVQPGLTTVGDARLLRSVMQNFVENAWKFTRDRDPAVVEFGAKAVDGAQWFFVRDNGVGFDMKYSEKLFQPFQRLHNTGEFEGTGIGLATVKRILARHGGRAWVQSELGIGTTFYFRV